MDSQQGSFSSSQSGQAGILDGDDLVDGPFQVNAGLAHVLSLLWICQVRMVGRIDLNVGYALVDERLHFVTNDPCQLIHERRRSGIVPVRHTGSVAARSQQCGAGNGDLEGARRVLGQEVSLMGCQSSTWSELAAHGHAGACLFLDTTGTMPLQRGRRGSNKSLHSIYQTPHEICTPVLSITKDIDSHLFLHFKRVENGTILSLAQLLGCHASLLVLFAGIEYLWRLQHATYVIRPYRLPRGMAHPSNPVSTASSKRLPQI